jgi:hypothetical protein
VYGAVISDKASMWSASPENQQNPEMSVPLWTR